MPSKNNILLHSYTYDPLDRHVKSGLSGATDTQLFYCRERVATEIKGDVTTQVFEYEDAVLAQRVHRGDTLTTGLLAGDQNRSTLSILNPGQRDPMAYTPYGQSPHESDTHKVLGFNGERQDPLTGYYLLGNGYRAFNPVLMRFNSPDSWSPFGEGGINAYAYCEGEPVNRVDPTGHMFGAVKKIFSRKSATPELSALTSRKGPASSNNYVQTHTASSPHSSAQQLPELRSTSGSNSNLSSNSSSSLSLSSSSSSNSLTTRPTLDELDQALHAMVSPGNSDRVLMATRAGATQRLGRRVMLHDDMWIAVPAPRTPRLPLSLAENRRLHEFTRQASHQAVLPPAPPVPERPASTLKTIRRNK